MKENNIKRDWTEALREKLGSYEGEMPKTGFEQIKAKMLAAEAARTAKRVALRRNILRGTAVAASLAAIITAGVLLAPDKAGVPEQAEAPAQVAEAVAPEEITAPDNNVVTDAATEPIHVVSIGNNDALAQATPGLDRKSANAMRKGFAEGQKSTAKVVEEEELIAMPGDLGDSVPMDAITPEEQPDPEEPVAKTAETSEYTADKTTTVRTIYDQPATEAVKPVRKQLRKFSLGASGFLAANSGRNNGDSRQYTPSGMMVTTDKYGNKYYSFGAPEIQYNYSAPVSAGISLRYDITNRLYAETGLRITYLSTTVSPSGSRQDLLFAGIPLGVGCTLLEWGNLDLYGSAYGMPSKCVWGRQGPSFPDNISGVSDVPLMWSAGIAPGVQYTFGEFVSLYAEPTISYYFKNEKAPETLYKENPFYFTVNVGVRFNL